MSVTRAKLASRPRKRAVSGGPKHQLVFVDRLPATLVRLRHEATRDMLACWFGVDRSTITQAIGEVPSPLASQGCRVGPDVQLRNLAEAVENLGSSGKVGIIDGTKTRVRRPASGLRNRDRFRLGQEAERRQAHSGHGQRRTCAVVEPGSSRDLRGHHPRSPVKGWPSSWAPKPVAGW
ncbi:transposase family protein [Streptomyces sp. NPDC055210]